MSDNKLQIKIENMSLNLNGLMFRNEIMISSVKDGYVVNAYSKCGVAYLIRYYTDRTIKETMQKTLIVETSNGDNVTIYAVYTSNPDDVIKVISDGIIPSIEYSRSFRNPDGFIKLRVKCGIKASDVRVRLFDVKKNDEFIQGIMMLLSACFRTEVYYSKDRYSYTRYDGEYPVTRVDLNTSLLSQFAKMTEFLVNPIENTVTGYESCILSRAVESLVPTEIAMKQYNFWCSEQQYQNLLRKAKRGFPYRDSWKYAEYYDEYDF